MSDTAARERNLAGLAGAAGTVGEQEREAREDLRSGSVNRVAAPTGDGEQFEAPVHACPANGAAAMSPWPAAGAAT